MPAHFSGERAGDMKEKIAVIIKESIKVKEDLAECCVDSIFNAAELIVSALKNKGKVILFGNGGSAADSQHIAAEFMGRFKLDRPSLAAVALSTNNSSLTAISNDYGFNEVFVRQIEGIGREGDVAIGISTSGNSPNVIFAVNKAKQMKIKTIGLTGGSGGELSKIVDVAIVAPSVNTPRIQEAHITIGHIICELVEARLFNA